MHAPLIRPGATLPSGRVGLVTGIRRPQKAVTRQEPSHDVIERSALMWGSSERRKALKTRTSNSEARASEAEKDDEKGASHAQNGVAEMGRGPANATSLEPA